MEAAIMDTVPRLFSSVEVGKGVLDCHVHYFSETLKAFSSTTSISDGNVVAWNANSCEASLQAPVKTLFNLETTLEDAIETSHHDELPDECHSFASSETNFIGLC